MKAEKPQDLRIRTRVFALSLISLYDIMLVGVVVIRSIYGGQIEECCYAPSHNSNS